MHTICRYLSSAVLVSLLAGAAGAQTPSATVAVNIDRQPMESALNALASQTGLQLLFHVEDIITPGLTAPRVVGTLSPEQALRQLLANSGLRYEFVNSRTVAIRTAKKEGQASTQSLRLTQAEVPRTAASTNEEEADEAAAEAGIPEILVKGRPSLNMDIRRSEDAPQPYVIFDHEEIQRSQALNLEEFLNTRLPMNNSGDRPTSYGTGTAITRSSINLRGLGANQTLILVDGRRMPGVSLAGRPIQPDINGIPISSVERIEVLPTTAGGIYGGSATGGVINIILRRDYQQLETRMNYANTFDTDAAAIRYDASAGFSLHQGRTRIMLSATQQSANTLMIRDRDFSARAIALQEKNYAPAITGLTSPPLGATANIRSSAGILTLDPQYGGASLGFTTTHLPVAYAGIASDNGASLIANAGRYNLALPDGMNGGERGLMAAPSKISATLNLRRELGSRMEGFLDLSRLGNEGGSWSAVVPTQATLGRDAPNNPFQQNIVVRFPTPGFAFKSHSESRVERATGGLIARLSGGWTGGMDYSWSRSHSENVTTEQALRNSVSAALNSGQQASLNPIRDTGLYPLDFSPYALPTPNRFDGPYETVMKNATLRFSGPVLQLADGPVNLSALIERRDEALQDYVSQRINAVSAAWQYAYAPERSQEADSFYLEAVAPLFSRKLQLQTSIRHDRYATTGDGEGGYIVNSRDGPFPEPDFITTHLQSTDYTLGLRYAPTESVAFRASFGTGFLPPSVAQVAPIRIVMDSSFGFTDPKRGFTDTFVGDIYTLLGGGNPDLDPERSESWSAGLVLTPRRLPGLRMSVDYSQIAKRDEIQFTFEQFILDNEDIFPGRVVRGPKRTIDPPEWAGPVTLIDARLMNIARTRVEAWDFQADYRVGRVRSGEMHAYLIATWQPHYENRIFPFSPLVDRVGYAGDPLEWRGNIGITWDRGPLTLAWNAQLYDSYLVYSADTVGAGITTAVRNQGSDTIPSQHYHDLIATWRFEGAAQGIGALLADAEISVGIQNVLDTTPPILASAEPVSAGYSGLGDPRLRRYSIALRKRFR